jgi:hypothetical protein
VGQLLGEVGNSGNTTEPHLHLHAERDPYGTGIPGVFLLLGGDPARPRRARHVRPPRRARPCTTWGTRTVSHRDPGAART